MNSFAHFIVGGPRLVISPESAVIRRPVKKGFVLTCRGEGSKPDLFTDLKWFDPNGDEIDRRNRKVIIKSEPEKLLLIFREPSSNDGGQYKCQGKFQFTEALEAQVDISFYRKLLLPVPFFLSFFLLSLSSFCQTFFYQSPPLFTFDLSSLLFLFFQTFYILWLIIVVCYYPRRKLLAISISVPLFFFGTFSFSPPMFAIFLSMSLFPYLSCSCPFRLFFFVPRLLTRFWLCVCLCEVHELLPKVSFLTGEEKEN